MIKKLTTSSHDERHMKRLAAAAPLQGEDTDYSNVVVQKPWGFEYMAFRNDNVCIWILFIKQNHQTSMHCHPNKKTSLVVLSGQVQFESLGGRMVVNTGQAIDIGKKVFHSTRAVSSPGALVMETETPVNKKDLVRLADQYGREGKGYEGKEHTIQRDTALYCSFHDIKGDYHRIPKRFGDCTVVIERYTDAPIIDSLLRLKSDIVCILKGALVNQQKVCFLRVGDTASVAELMENDSIEPEGEEVELLCIQKHINS